MSAAREFPDAPRVGVGAVVLDGERVLLARRGRAPSMMAPCWRKAVPCRRCALPTSFRPSTSSSNEPVRAKQKAGMAAGFDGCTGTISTGAPRARRPDRSPAPIQR